MTSATDELRRLLDERGVEYGGSDAVVYFEDERGYKACAYDAPRRYGECVLCVSHTATPEQAIAATLGSCNCSNSERTNGACIPVLDSERDGMPYLNPRFVCSECGCQLTESRLGKVWQNFCPNCGAKIVGSTTNDVDAEADE